MDRGVKAGASREENAQKNCEEVGLEKKKKSKKTEVKDDPRLQCGVWVGRLGGWGEAG